MAREERGTGNWFIGGITGDERRKVKLKLDFLEEGKEYQCVVYHDGAGALSGENREEIIIDKLAARKGQVIEVDLGPGGGFAVSLMGN